MTIQRTNIIKIIGAVVAILLQVILAPNIALFGSFPNIPLVYVLVVAVASPHTWSPVLPFVVGLVCDLLGSGPVGALALLFLLASLVLSQYMQIMNNDSLFMPLSCLFVGLLLVEAFYGFLMVALGLPVSALSAFVGRAAPCALYDCAIALVLYPLVHRLLMDDVVVSKNNMPHVKLR